ncbi:hypothetical protein H920_19451 [Fukomys damarensis]|uniref:Uncharacterized protein n=1 Tax=Fukomys damarensis TaxID=885580 RepID=A0A091CMK4_FUKDA|nr:hypothetical protein H920_19451 [Fukomys damarensis]
MLGAGNTDNEPIMLQPHPSSLQGRFILGATLQVETWPCMQLYPLNLAPDMKQAMCLTVFFTVPFGNRAEENPERSSESARVNSILSVYMD